MSDDLDARPDRSADPLRPAGAIHGAAAAAVLRLRDPTPHPWARYWAKMIDGNNIEACVRGALADWAAAAQLCIADGLVCQNYRA